jgi:hypothetical protein
MRQLLLSQVQEALNICILRLAWQFGVGCSPAQRSVCDMQNVSITDTYCPPVVTVLESDVTIF